MLETWRAAGFVIETRIPRPAYKRNIEA